jgi:hypothetical protein
LSPAGFVICWAPQLPARDAKTWRGSRCQDFFSHLRGRFHHEPDYTTLQLRTTT